jgi:hypothetical protein
MPVQLAGRESNVSRHLDPGFFAATLNRGRAIECFLGPGERCGDEPTIRWASIRKSEDGFVARLYEAFDPRQPGFFDIYAFRSTSEEPDEPICEESHPDLDLALARVRSWGGDTARFVNQGMAGHEYGDYLARAG